MNEVLYFKPVKIIAEIKLNGKKNKREMQDKKLFLNLRASPIRIGKGVGNCEV